MKSKLLIIGLLIVLSFVGLEVYGESHPLDQPKQQVKTQAVSVQPPTVEQLYKLTEAERAKVGAKPLILDPRLNASAQMKANDMAEHHYFAHQNPITGKQGITFLKETTPSGFCTFASENLVLDDPYGPSQDLVASWMASTPHREALLNPRFEEVGFAINGKYVVAHYCDSAPG